MLGHLMEWLYSGVGGIRQAENSIAFNHIKIEPEVVGDLTSADVHYHSPYGKISCKWEKTDRSFTLEVNIPVNTKATIYFPVLPKYEISEEYNSTFTDTGIEAGKAKVALGSGHYKFNLKYK
jgi:hypothetical protein